MAGDANEHDPAAVLEELVGLVQDQLQVRALRQLRVLRTWLPALAAHAAARPAQVLTYKWVARQYSMPANLAKR
jgi:hypothetical protein